ncbi:MarR family winged helix-turn-helix transcriptional regulator [Streptomyces goshikiensis]|uniref:MarR family winged helix-turn-helix transcriptional regulator n=1 Tax=Streptomyces goshikiensis TaxID=1942 RepID=UPI0037108F9F
MRRVPPVGPKAPAHVHTSACSPWHPFPRLERAGYVRRTADPADRRKVVVEAVPDALAGVESAVGPARKRIGEVLAGYTPDQQDLLFDYFSRAAPAFREATEEIRASTQERKGGR